VEKRNPRARVKRRATVTSRFEMCVQVTMSATLISFRYCRSAYIQIPRARVGGECGCTTAPRSREGGGGPSAVVVGKTTALYETVLLGAIFQFASDAVEMRNYLEAFLKEGAALE
jgi:hypothetical protein